MGRVTKVRSSAWLARARSLFSLAALVAGLLMGLFTSVGASAAQGQTVINYPNGFAASNGHIWLENYASLSGSEIHLVPSVVHNGSNAWFETPENIQAFTTTFTFRVDCSAQPSNCGDGLGFEIICACTGGNPTYDPATGHPGYTYSGFSSGQFSWSQCEIPLSPASQYCFNTGSNGNTGSDLTQLPDNVLVKFDLYNNATNQPGANITGYYTNGQYPQAPYATQYDMSAAGINIQSGHLFRATLTYNGTTLSESLTDTVTNATYTNSYSANIPAAITGNTGFIGFGGGTGAAIDDVYLDSWTYTVETPGQASPPTFSPAAGTYTGSQSVTLATPTQGAVICYNTSGSPATNGSSGCATGNLYSGPVTVASSETLYAVAGGAGYSDSPGVSAAYVIQVVTATPTFSPAGGTYSSAQTVTISDDTANAAIYYTTNGTTPTTSSTRYTGAITVSATETLKAIAVANGDSNSAVATATYTITPLPPAATPTFSPAGGTYSSPESVTISAATAGATIYYTADGSTPTTSSTQYTAPITVSTTETLKAISVATGDSTSAVGSAAYTIDASLPPAETPTFSPGAGNYTSTQLVTISDGTADATIYYTTNGAMPTTSSTEYTGPITVSSTETVEAIAVAMGDSSSAVATSVYTINSALPTAATPIFAPAAGAYTSAQSVVISDATPGASIYYTTNGSTPTTSSTAYSGPVSVSATETLEAIAIATGDSNSAIGSAAYTINSTLPAIPTPTFSPAAGTYNSAQSVTISDATSGATIYYTTDGSTPTTSSSVYSGPITVSSTETLQAIAAASGQSAVASAAYTITAQPNFLLGASTTSLTLNSGSQGTVLLTVTPENGFNSPVILACSSLPAWATCSFEQATVTPSTGAATTQLTISTNAQSAALRTGHRGLFPFTALAMTVGLFGRRRRRGLESWVSRGLLLLLVSAGLGLLFGCNSASGGSGTGSPTTSTVMVTAISGTLQGTAAITVTVN